MNLYMGFDSAAGSAEGAVLIFANTSKEARKIGWPVMKELYDTPWLTMSVRRLRRNLEHLQKQAVQEGPHCIYDIEYCPNCELWGEDMGEIDDEGRCGYCRDE